jgi:phosphohistidine phosphatase
MDVYFVRHAVAEQRDPSRWPDDVGRPLTEKGRAGFRSAARGLRRVVPSVDVVLASPYVRSWQTAEILSEEAGWPAPEPCAALEPGHPAEDALKVLAGRTLEAVALVGHEPHLSSLVSLLTVGRSGGLRMTFKKGAVALVVSDVDPAPGDGLLVWAMTPAILRALDGAP